MIQHNTTDEQQQAINRLIAKDNSIVRHGFNVKYYTDNELIMMVIKN